MAKIHPGKEQNQTQAAMNSLIDVTFGSKGTAVVFVHESGPSVVKTATSVVFLPAARPGHLCVRSDGSGWTVQSPGGGKHPQWVSVLWFLSVFSDALLIVTGIESGKSAIEC